MRAEDPSSTGAELELQRDLEEVQTRLMDLEERMDMADRLLAAQKRQKPPSDPDGY